MTAASPYFTELEAARYCRAGVARLKSWADRGFVVVRTDVDGRRFYLRDELDRVMTGLVELPPARARVVGVDAVAGSPGARNDAATATASKPTGQAGSPSKKKPPKRPALPYTDPEKDTRRRGKGGRR